ncbi:hypothetical protein PSACC_02829 [Paramicrosporidium saccamoebae]|uniref:Uncharacterized protein n=1 Tax=Paramicrosporidium saccamoebae TaxID=1246581 RepID=A0A2H9THT4_9FUNG|nr:hypothetical protein PSACC_02829 [Paramicrosporidium saccamoebae]
MAFPTNSAVRPIPGMAQNELHYMASIRYPIITQPLGMDRVVMLLNKAREAISRMSFHWVILKHPKNGECFLLVRPENNSFRAPDGYQWKKLPDTLEIARFESAGPPNLVRLEYRLMLPNNRLIFVHYLTRESLVAPPVAAKAPNLAYPDLRVQAAMARPPIRSPMQPPGLQGFGSTAGPKQVTIRKVSAVPAQNQAPRQPGEDLLDLVNGTDQEVAREELEALQETANKAQLRRDKMKVEHDRVLTEINELDCEATIFTLTKDWAEIAEVKAIRRIPPIVKHK